MTQNLTILFDLDGTLVNTAPDLMAAHNHVMRTFGFEEKKMEDIKSLAGKGAWVGSIGLELDGRPVESESIQLSIKVE